MLVARDDAATILGVCAMALPGRCQPTARQRLRMMPALIGLGPRSLRRVLHWTGAWARHNPPAPHWHLGPLAVDAGRQGRGIGTRLMEAFCERIDAAGATAWLETDKAINVRFYERVGFATGAEEPVLGATTWYMIRRPRPEIADNR